MLYELAKDPSNDELNKIIAHHAENYLDYCRVWFDDGSTKVYYNTMPIFGYDPPKCYVDFRNPIIYGEGKFGKMGIIRAKRVCRKILDK